MYNLWSFAHHSGYDRRGAHFTYRSSGEASQGGRSGFSETTLEAEGKLGVRSVFRRILGLQDTGFEYMSVVVVSVVDFQVVIFGVVMGEMVP